MQAERKNLLWKQTRLSTITTILKIFLLLPIVRPIFNLTQDYTVFNNISHGNVTLKGKQKPFLSK